MRRGERFANMLFLFGPAILAIFGTFLAPLLFIIRPLE